ncbi:FCSD flavin-binding domain-containing protein [Piscinibacter sakaiensis]|uniref:FCSD flavin-binding domain-containing protein n=1 Tax=Piscinibacter sakaiensis TaxID=1547922 RepID=UPI003AAE516B
MNGRRDLLKLVGAGAALASLGGCAAVGGRARPKVVVIGAGFGGATAARYLRMWSNGRVDVDLVERGDRFISCPLSNLVLGGSRQIADISTGYDALRSRHGVRLIRDEAVAVDAAKRQVRLAGGTTLGYDRLIVSPGIDFMYQGIPGLSTEAAREAIPHAWKAGPQTLALRSQLQAMADGGVFAMHIPRAPYRCPPGPYERVCQVASYLKKVKPRSKILVLDANADIQSKKGLFTKAWDNLYPGMIEYRPNSELMDVDVRTRTAKLTFSDVRADVLNVIPPQKAAAIATPFITANDRWCETDWLSCESKAAAGVHIIGDATQSAPAMPKSGHMANQHGHLAAAAVIALLDGRQPSAGAMITNTCYSFVSDAQAVHVASVHHYDAAKKTYVSVEGSGGVSPDLSEPEATYAHAWARNIWSDVLG